MSFEDKTLNCRDCGNDFVFTAGEQAFYAEKGFTNEPRRCPDCRRAYKASRDGGASYGGSYGRSERTMHPAVCSACGKDTMVPFVPRNDRPVYCSECFQTQREQRSYSRY